MPLYESEAIVLRSIRYKETDRIVTFFTRGYGKIGGIAKGSRKTKNRFGTSLEPFSHVHLIYFGKENAHLFRVNSADSVHPFQVLREDYDRMKRCAFFIDLVNSSQKELDPSFPAFELTLRFLQAMERCEAPERWDPLVVLFELQYLSAIGYRFELDSCVYCGRKRGARSQNGFNPGRGGVVCGTCLAGDPTAERVQAGTVNLMKMALGIGPEKLTRIAVSPAIFPQLRTCVHRFRVAHLGFELKTAKFFGEPKG